MQFAMWEVGNIYCVVLLHKLYLRVYTVAKVSVVFLSGYLFSISAPPCLEDNEEREDKSRHSF